MNSDAKIDAAKIFQDELASASRKGGAAGATRWLILNGFWPTLGSDQLIKRTTVGAGKHFKPPPTAVRHDADLSSIDFFVVDVKLPGGGFLRSLCSDGLTLVQKAQQKATS